LSSKQPISFFIHLYFFWYDAVDCVHLENQNNEKLEIKVVDENDDEMVISRYPIGTTDEWIKEMNPNPKPEWTCIVNYLFRNIKIR
jgi:hypothetical protein